MSSLQLLRNRAKLGQMAKLIMKQFDVPVHFFGVDLGSLVARELNTLNLQQSEELIRELKAILDG